jgi:hypothetical protein
MIIININVCVRLQFRGWVFFVVGVPIRTLRRRYVDKFTASLVRLWRKAKPRLLAWWPLISEVIENWCLGNPHFQLGCFGSFEIFLILHGIRILLSLVAGCRHGKHPRTCSWQCVLSLILTCLSAWASDGQSVSGECYPYCLLILVDWLKCRFSRFWRGARKSRSGQ